MRDKHLSVPAPSRYRSPDGTLAAKCGKLTARRRVAWAAGGDNLARAAGCYNGASRDKVATPVAASQHRAGRVIFDRQTQAIWINGQWL